MKKRLLSLCLALPLVTVVVGCDSSDAPAAPNGGKAVDNSKDVAAPPPADPAPGKKAGPAQGTIKAP